MSEEEEQNRFSLRKLSIGLASVLVGVSIFGTSQTVKADTVADQNTSAVTSNAQSSDTQENKNAVKSSFSNNNQVDNAKSNLIQTQVEGKKEQKQVQTENGQQDSVSKTQEATDSNDLDAEKNIVRTSSLQKTDNQSNDHTEDNSQTQNEQKLDLTKNSKKFAKKVLATNLIATPPMTNGGFDPKIWGTMDTSKWQLDNNGNITGYTGDMSHIIIPNASDFAKVGKIYQQIGISSDEMQNLGGVNNSEANTLAISLTDNKKVKATNADWSDTFDSTLLKQANLEGLDTGNVTNMSCMFLYAHGLTSLDVSNWNTGNVTNMNSMFYGANSLTSLDVSDWDTSNVIDMDSMFLDASSLTSLDVSNWDTSKVADMGYMFYDTDSLTSLDVSNWDTSKVTDMYGMFGFDRNLALIANSGKFADYLVNHDSFAKSTVDSDVKSVTTDNTKLLQLLTSDVQHNSATRTIVFTFPANYSPDLTKYHLTKNGNTYQIKQSADYDKPYLQGTVLINATYDITAHHIDTTKRYKLSDTWQPNYDKLVLAHKNSDGSVSFDIVRLPKVPGYKAKVSKNNGLFMVNYLVFAPEKPETNNNLNELQFSNKLVTNSTVQFNSTIKSNIVIKSNMYQVVNDDHNWQLPVIKSYELKFATNKDQIIFAYTKDKQYNYRFVLIFKDGQYHLATFDKQNKLRKTYSIKSYKELTKIINALVLINIA